MVWVGSNETAGGVELLLRPGDELLPELGVVLHPFVELVGQSLLGESGDEALNIAELSQDFIHVDRHLYAHQAPGPYEDVYGSAVPDGKCNTNK